MNSPSVVLKCCAEPSRPQLPLACQASILQALSYGYGAITQNQGGEKVCPFVPEASLESAKGSTVHRRWKRSNICGPRRGQQIKKCSGQHRCEADSQGNLVTLPGVRKTLDLPQLAVLAGWHVSKRDTPQIKLNLADKFMQ